MLGLCLLRLRRDVEIGIAWLWKIDRVLALGLGRVKGVAQRLSVCRGLPDLRNPISSSIISLLFLPPELR